MKTNIWIVMHYYCIAKKKRIIFMFGKIEIQPLTQIIIFNKVDSSHISVICLWKSEPALHSQGSIQQQALRSQNTGCSCLFFPVLLQAPVTFQDQYHQPTWPANWRSTHHSAGGAVKWGLLDHSTVHAWRSRQRNPRNEEHGSILYFVEKNLDMFWGML